MYKSNSRLKYRRPSLKISKYSVENYYTQINLAPLIPGNNATMLVGDATMADTGTGNVLGTRKLKNFHLKISMGEQASDYTDAQGVNHITNYNAPYQFALIFVPQGTNTNGLNLSGAAPNSQSLYEPNQNVICSGNLHPIQGEKEIFIPLSRNLNYQNI